VAVAVAIVVVVVVVAEAEAGVGIVRMGKQCDQIWVNKIISRRTIR
jgi:hypothetical protein